jgi:hypothetical protein
MSARNYWSDAELIDDARENRRAETECKLRARAELDPSDTLRNANTAKLRAEASEAILRQRAVAAEQMARSGCN